MTTVVIVGAARTPVGSFGRSFEPARPTARRDAGPRLPLERAGVAATDVDEVILGQVLAGGGQNPARQAAMAAGVPQEATAWGLNQLCGSGLRAVALGLQQIANGDAKIIVAGGMESMSQSQHAAYLRGGVKMGSLEYSTMLKDGLTDAFHIPRGATAENIATRW